MTATLSLSKEAGHFSLFKKEPKERSQFTYFLLYHKWTILFLVLFAVFLLTTIFAGYCVKTWADFGGKAGDPQVPGLLGTLVNYGGTVDKLFGFHNMSEYAELLYIHANGTNFSIGGIDNLPGLGAVLAKVNDLFKVIAWGLALIFWGYSYAEMMLMSNGQMILEQILKKLVFLVVAFVVIDNSLALCCEIVNAGTELTSQALASIVGDVNVPPAWIDGFKKEIFDSSYNELQFFGKDFSGIWSTFGAIQWWIALSLPLILTIVCNFVISFLCWSRAVEICIFAAISPIMFMDLGSTRELTHSSTARAIKNLMALAMQGALIVIALTICQAIMGGIVSGGSTLSIEERAWRMVLVSILQVGTIGKTQSIARQSLGV